jgi:2-amino-4-hydroxy-6-hydroxymethyldihydropteridine diphosphokinase
MKKTINKELKLFFTSNYPYISNKNSNKTYKVTLGIGGNISNVIHTFNKLFTYMKSNTKIDIIKTSPILQNPPFGYLEQNDFLNAIIVIKTNQNPAEVLRMCWLYENRLGRKRTFQDAPRTLDIDIIFIKKQNKYIKLNTKDLIVPHKGYKQRPSVLIPLKYV